jgi:RNA polymerase sigma-70 factor (ECF subfamily)
MEKSTASDQQLIDRFRQMKDQDALGELFLRYMELVYGVCLKYTGQPEAAQDAVMDIYEHINRKLPDHEVANFGAWLYMVSKNHCLQHLRRKNTVLTVSLDDPVMQNGRDPHQEDTLPELVASPDMDDQLHDCIHRLPGQQALCIRMFYFDKQSYADISVHTEMTLDQVRSNIQNGRRNLKKCLELKKGHGTGKHI